MRLRILGKEGEIARWVDRPRFYSPSKSRVSKITSFGKKMAAQKRGDVFWG